MLLHIGNGKMVRGEEIIGIFDLDNATVCGESRRFLSCATKKGEVTYADSDIPRAFVVVCQRKKERDKSNPAKDGTKGQERAQSTEQRPPLNSFVGGGARAPRTSREETPRSRHPARRGGSKTPPPAQTVLLSHISSAALHARCERPLFDED